MSTMIERNAQTQVKTATGGKRRILRGLSRGLLGIVVVVAALVAGGMIFESVMAAGDAERFSAPGQMVSVDGQIMHIMCVGEGSPAGESSPTIIFEAEFGAWSDAWTLVEPEVGKEARACAYDRAGLGWSESGELPRSPARIAQELHALLNAAGIQPPYVLVGHSSAGKSIRLFADLYPAEVAGLMFVDARHESLEPVGRTAEQNARDQQAYEASFGLQRTLRQTGIVRLFGVSLARALDPSLSSPALSDDLVYRLAMFGVRETTIQTMLAESSAATDNDDQLRAAQLPADLPIVVLTADSSLQAPGWEDGQRQLAALSTNSRWTVVEHTSHNIQNDQPQAVISALKELIASAQSGAPLAAD